MSEEERRTLVSDVESARLNIAETERMLQVATTRNDGLEEEIRAMRGETEGYTAKVSICCWSEVNVFCFGLGQTCDFFQHAATHCHVLSERAGLIAFGLVLMEKRLNVLGR